MKHHYSRIPSFILLFICISICSLQAQDESEEFIKEKAQKRYKVVQGISYLHTQVKLIIDNWGVHPLSETTIDKFEKEYQKHFIEEFEHDEKWVEIMLEKNLLDGFGNLDSKVEGAIQKNLVFYQEVYALVKKPKLFTSSLKSISKRMDKAEKRLYDTIFPALIH